MLLASRFRPCSGMRGLGLGVQRRGASWREAAPALEEGGLPQPPRGWRLTHDGHRALVITERPDDAMALWALEQQLADRGAAAADAAAAPPLPTLPLMSVAVVLTASNRRPLSKTKREPAAQRSLFARGRRHVRPAGVSLPDTVTQFTFTLEPLARPPGRVLVGTGSCVGDGVSIDGVALADSSDIVISPSPEAEQQHRRRYQGPALNQRVPAELALGQLSAVPPTAPLRQRHVFLGNPDFDPDTIFTKYCHYPAHTVSPRAYQAILRYVKSFGVDDNLATYLKELDLALRRRALSRWREDILPVLQRPVYP